jgi:hypothetical protein
VLASLVVLPVIPAGPVKVSEPPINVVLVAVPPVRKLMELAEIPPDSVTILLPPV